MSPPRFIPPDTIKEITDKADLLSIVQHYHAELKKTGSSYKGVCPSCRSDAFTITPGKNISKCFKCGQGGSGALGYMQEMRGLTYLDALHALAELMNIVIPEVSPTSSGPAPTPPKPGKRKSKTDTHETPAGSFRDQQLRASGIPEEAQQYILNIDDGEKLCNRYTEGSLDSKGQPGPGQDMLIHYIDLDGLPIMYQPKDGRKVEKPYIRTRYANPRIHDDIRYVSPVDSGNHLWIPEYIRARFKSKTKIPTLVFIEGEKKADALCVADIPAVGIAGIFNFATSNEMPSHIERLITTCGVSNVIFWFDSDMNELGSDTSKDVSRRPNLFSKAAIKFRAYFEKYQRESVNIQIWICYGRDIEHKGADDLLQAIKSNSVVSTTLIDQPGEVGEVLGSQPSTLADDFFSTLKLHSGEGYFIRLHQITSWSDYQIRELWHLQSPRAFINHHKAALMDIGEFKIHNHRYTWDPTKDDGKGDFVSSQKLSADETYWFEVDTKVGKQLQFDHYNITVFLDRRGFAKYRTGPGQYRLIREDNNIVSEVYPEDVQSFVYEFTDSIDFNKQFEKIRIMRMLMKGGTQYLGADKLKNLAFTVPSFIKPSRDHQILCFQDTFWIVTPKEITVHQYRDMPGKIWASDVIPFKPKKIDNFLEIDTEDKSGVFVNCAHPESEFYRYIHHTSDIHWRDAHPEAPGGNKYIDGFPAKRSDFSEKDEKRFTVLMGAMADKIIATGYILSNFIDPANCKAVICMDAHETKTGRSEGGTGKSIWGLMFKYMFKDPTSFKRIDGKSLRTDDPFVYDGVDDRTRVITFDDCRRNLEFEYFFSAITSGIIANWKGGKRFDVGIVRMIFGTNHSVRGEDRSALRRQYTIGFSDFFNSERDPYSIFGHSLFKEWNDEEWNYWVNFMAYSLQMFMRFGLKTFAPDEDIKRRKQRDFIGESWLEFFESYFYQDSEYLNVRFEIKSAIEAFGKQYPLQKQYATKGLFKDKVQTYCDYAGYNYNIPGGADGRIRDGGKNIEYFVISDQRFDRTTYDHKVKHVWTVELPPSF